MNKFAGDMAAAFENELKKIGVAKLQKTAAFLHFGMGSPVAAVAKPMIGTGTKLLAAALAGGAGAEYLRRANNDRRSGLSMRSQPSY